MITLRIRPFGALFLLFLLRFYVTVAFVVKLPSCRRVLKDTKVVSMKNGNRPTHQLRRNTRWHYVHSAVVPPFNTSLSPLFEDTLSQLQKDFDQLFEYNRNQKDDNVDDNESIAHDSNDSNDDENSGRDLKDLCQMLNAQPQNAIRLESTPDGERGVFLNYPVQQGEVILSIPLSSCLCDNKVPTWMMSSSFEEENTADDSDNDATTIVNCYNNPSAWATNLAASLIDMQLCDESGALDEGHALWLSMLPNREFLHASLPVHWTEETVQNACSTPLELAVDSAYFARYQANEDIIDALKARDEEMDKDTLKINNNEMDLLQACSDALDVVQTRSCRLERSSKGRTYGPPLRVLAPIFDFINHGSSRVPDIESGANAQFGLEEGGGENSRSSDVDEDWQESARLVVRSTRDMKAGEEVLIDYGESARPAWKCLLSYGFVPEYQRDDVDDDDDNVAEVYMDGIRYEVGPSFVPVDMVAAAGASLREESAAAGGESTVAKNNAQQEDQIVLTPEIASRLAKRISDVAYLLLLEPELDMYDDDPSATPTLFQVISNRLSSSLRWSQYRVLLACASGLGEYANDE